MPRYGRRQSPRSVPGPPRHRGLVPSSWCSPARRRSARRRSRLGLAPPVPALRRADGRLDLHAAQTEGIAGLPGDAQPGRRFTATGDRGARAMGEPAHRPAGAVRRRRRTGGRDGDRLLPDPSADAEPEDRSVSPALHDPRLQHRPRRLHAGSGSTPSATCCPRATGPRSTRRRPVRSPSTPTGRCSTAARREPQNGSRMSTSCWP